MFGEDDTDSPPRLSSPWEAFSSSPSVGSFESSVSSSDIEAELTRRLGCEVPRLVPEIEEGNVEYKLKLSPSPERLTRLITQLKWRLLEGGGQALYEIGVGDDGQLVGLSRKDMEKSLDALERMAGELGATVVIAKEIVVPKGVIEGVDANGKVSPVTPGSGSGESEEFEPFSLELDSPGSTPPSSHNYIKDSYLKPIKTKSSNNRRAKLAQKAEHKRIRREVKRTVNAAYTIATSPLLGTVPNDLIDEVVVSNMVPAGLGVPEIIVPEVVVVDAIEADDVAGSDIVVPFESVPVVPESDEVIIVEALVVRKLALEEAFLDFGGFSVLG